VSVDTKEMREAEEMLCDTLECATFPGEHASEEACDAVMNARELLRSAADELDELREMVRHQETRDRTADEKLQALADSTHALATTLLDRERSAHDATKRELEEARAGWKQAALELDGYHEGGVPQRGTRIWRCEHELTKARTELEDLRARLGDADKVLEFYKSSPIEVPAQDYFYRYPQKGGAR
jgi:chromosome segregation ATPase